MLLVRHAVCRWEAHVQMTESAARINAAIFLERRENSSRSLARGTADANLRAKGAMVLHTVVVAEATRG